VPKQRDVIESVAALERILLENIVPFWFPGTLDTRHGGYQLNHGLSGRFLGPADKYIVTQARVVWFFSRLARSKYGRREHLAAARHGYEFLRDRMWDARHGGFFWAVDSTGKKAVVPQKHLYGQAFALYALTEYAAAARSAEALRLARKLFHHFDARAHDDEFGGYVECFDNDWRPAGTRTPNPMKHRSATDKLMNTHLHLMEALTPFCAATHDPLAEKRLRELILIQSGTVVRRETGACSDKFRRDWTPVRKPSYERVSYGHDVENVWLLMDACAVAGVPRSLLRSLYVALFDNALKYGFDPRQGGFFDGGPFGAPADKRGKTWWTQVEALVSALYMQRLTGEERYFEVFRKTLDWTVRHQVDWRGGEWFYGVSERGAASGYKAGPWKGPYHQGRAMLRCLEILSVSS
jgi:cellobiose epimerase